MRSPNFKNQVGARVAHLASTLYPRPRLTPGNLLTSNPAPTLVSAPATSLQSNPVTSLQSDPLTSLETDPTTSPLDQNAVSTLYLFLESSGRIPADSSESSLKNLPTQLIAALQTFSTFHPMNNNSKGGTPTQR